MKKIRTNVHKNFISLIRNSKAGVTLTELLVVMVILGIAIVGIMSLVPRITKTYQRYTTLAEADMLSATIVTALENELRFAENPESDGLGNIAFYSTTFGENSHIMVKDENGADITDDFGYIYIGNAKKSYQLFSDETYTKNLGAMIELTYDDTTGLFHLTLTIGQKGGSGITKHEITVRNASK